MGPVSACVADTAAVVQRRVPIRSEIRDSKHTTTHTLAAEQQRRAASSPAWSSTCQRSHICASRTGPGTRLVAALAQTGGLRGLASGGSLSTRTARGTGQGWRWYM